MRWVDDVYTVDVTGSSPVSPTNPSSTFVHSGAWTGKTRLFSWAVEGLCRSEADGISNDDRGLEDLMCLVVLSKPFQND